MEQQNVIQTEVLEDRTNKYLTFGLGEEIYGLEIMQVSEVIGMMQITRVPRMPDFIRGVINLRGRVIPVMDLRARFNMQAVEIDRANCVVVTRVGEIDMGLMVDRVLEVVDIPDSQIEPVPAFGADIDAEFIKGIGKTGDNITMLFDADKLLTGGELTSLPQE